MQTFVNEFEIKIKKSKTKRQDGVTKSNCDLY